MTNSQSTLIDTSNLAPNDQLLISCYQKKLSGGDIELSEVIKLVDTATDSSKLRDWLVVNKVCTNKEFYSALKKHENYNKLGGSPETCTELFDMVVDKYNVELSYKKEIRKSKLTTKHIEELRKEQAIHEQRLDQFESQGDNLGVVLEKESISRIESSINVSSRIYNLEDLCRKTRILSKELHMPFSAADIADVAQEWVHDQRSRRKLEIFEKIKFRPREFSKQRIAWDKISECFDFEEKQGLSLPAKEACIKHFIWQVKRKMRNLPIENHMMVILLGPQGIGKTSWMHALLKPVYELTSPTDFKQITDDRNIDIWENYVLVTDEMGWASKSNIDSIKQLVTADSLSRRYMRTNSATPVAQNATFIGASNRELDQLIRDETGARRFIGIRMKSHDWQNLKDIQMHILWNSVNEEDTSPIMDYMDEVKCYQERVRSETSVERWVNVAYSDFNDIRNKPVKGDFLFSKYKSWSSESFQKKIMDFDDWLAEMSRLCIDHNFSFIKVSNASRPDFMFIKERAESKIVREKDYLENIENIRIKRNTEFAQRKFDLGAKHIRMAMENDMMFDFTKQEDIEFYINKSGNADNEPKYDIAAFQKLAVEQLEKCNGNYTAMSSITTAITDFEIGKKEVESETTESSNENEITENTTPESKVKVNQVSATNVEVIDKDTIANINQEPSKHSKNTEPMSSSDKVKSIIQRIKDSKNSKNG